MDKPIDPVDVLCAGYDTGLLTISGREKMRRAVSALEARGLRIVGPEPTPAMAVGARAVSAGNVTATHAYQIIERAISLAPTYGDKP